MSRLFAYNRSVDEYNQNALAQLPMEKMQKYVAIDSGIYLTHSNTIKLILLV